MSIRAILTTDVVASTEIVQTLGDAGWLRVIDEHDELVRTLIERTGGVVFKHTGDGIRTWFWSADAAVSAARSVLGEFGRRRLLGGRVEVRLRVGVALGAPLVRSDGDLCGLAVIEAGRLCDAAPSGAGLASAAVAAAVTEPLTPHGSLVLKGFCTPVETVRIDPAPAGIVAPRCVGVAS